ncbi:unnamed protein product [Chrysodeixis includens]|uniref:Gem-associated protein 8 n=1 Tax=Chrysodeixis includens TaxID=689277 RepID=A0A9N8PZZ0_CHRIL|nr:unnamed protein product [Chrysodeixis includens]
MFPITPDNSQNNSTVSQNTSHRKRQKKSKRKNKQKNHGVKRDLFKRNNVRSTPITMSAWAENFAFAATWQLKHQVAYWKSKAIALEYENKLLHDIIRKNCGNVLSDDDNASNSCSDNEENEEIASNETEDELEQEEVEEIHEDGDLEVSEEFIQFLRENKKFRDDAKRERERLRDEQHVEDRSVKEMEAGPLESMENPQQKLQRLYGDGSDRIAALEASMRSQYISICDREKPLYWPNIPFNFNFA